MCSRLAHLPSQLFSLQRKKNPEWNGQTLYPPARKHKNQSEAWKYGGFIREKNGQLNTNAIICGECGKSFPYNSSPAPLLNHVQNNHYEKTGKVSSQNIKTFFPSKVNKKYNQTNAKQKAIRSSLVKWIIRRKRPISIVTDPELVESFELADPQFKMPSRLQVRNDILERYGKEKQKVIKELENVDYCCSTNDGGSSRDNKCFVNINAHYISSDFELRKKVLGVAESKEKKTAKNYRSKVDSVLTEFGLISRTFCHTTDNENKMNAAFRAKERNGCLAHIESKSCKKAVKKVKVLDLLLKKLGKVAKKANKSNNFKNEIERRQKLKGLKTRTLKKRSSNSIHLGSHHDKILFK